MERRDGGKDERKGRRIDGAPLFMADVSAGTLFRWRAAAADAPAGINGGAEAPRRDPLERAGRSGNARRLGPEERGGSFVRRIMWGGPAGLGGGGGAWSHRDAG